MRGLGLDFYQVHWYEPLGWAALADPADRFGLDRPVLLGEFPGRGASATPADIVLAARRAGYMGALIWSVTSQDDVSRYVEGLALASAFQEEGQNQAGALPPHYAGRRAP